ncbi:Stigma-specific Stig1 family protein [Trifolium repens]|nr:Stigma-specific Stig1 family protein [Trifolium repens]
MNIIQVNGLAFVTFLMLLLININGDSTPNVLPQNVTNVSSSYSPWLKKDMEQRPYGCRRRPWVCSNGEFPPRSMCCRNRCVNVTSDKNNCGFCSIRCPFNWQCCRGFCRDINWSIFNCGRCGHRCPFGEFCFYGMCGYGMGSSPFRPRLPKQKQPKPPQIPYIPSYHHPPPPDARKEEF